MSLHTLSITATIPQLSTYLLCVCLFSISFLVFLNSSVSFIITDRIGQKSKVGDAVGTLGFADEVFALVACPIWGVLSDKIGVRSVAVIGYAIVGLALMVFVRARNVYPELLLARLFFALGGAATSTMVTAILPCMTQDDKIEEEEEEEEAPRTPSIRRSPSPSTSDITITQTMPLSIHSSPPQASDPVSTSSKLAGFVGLFTGLGALLALLVFLPLPARLTSPDHPRSEALATSYTIVGFIALAISIICAFGLRNLPGERHKRLTNILAVFRTPQTDIIFPAPPENEPSSFQLLWEAIKLAVKDRTVLLAYVAGFVARASSVAISLFIPLLVNASFVASGRCKDTDNGSGEWKDECRQAYVVASILTGVSQLIALICAPAFGFLGGKSSRTSWPLLTAAAAGVLGYAVVGARKMDLDFDSKRVSVFWPGFAVVALLGFSQIGAIVCSLALLARAVQDVDYDESTTLDSDDATTLAASSGEEGDDVRREQSPLLRPRGGRFRGQDRAQLKGSMAGVYSLSGGAGILILTKLGGRLFDDAGWGWPFYLMAGFNGALLLVGVYCATRRQYRRVAVNIDSSPL